MVNKQYNVQKLGKNKTKNPNHHHGKEQLKQSITVIPNDTTLNDSNGARDFYHSQNAFDRNIIQQYYHSLNDSFDLVDGHFENNYITSDNTSMGDIVKQNMSAAADQPTAAGAATDANDTQSQKQLSIDDIERFQYILQMDREMVSVPIGSDRAEAILIYNYFRLILTHFTHTKKKLPELHFEFWLTKYYVWKIVNHDYFTFVYVDVSGCP